MTTDFLDALPCLAAVTGPFLSLTEFEGGVPIVLRTAADDTARTDLIAAARDVLRDVKSTDNLRPPEHRLSVGLNAIGSRIDAVVRDITKEITRDPPTVAPEENIQTPKPTRDDAAESRRPLTDTEIRRRLRNRSPGKPGPTLEKAADRLVEAVAGRDRLIEEARRNGWTADLDAEFTNSAAEILRAATVFASRWKAYRGFEPPEAISTTRVRVSYMPRSGKEKRTLLVDTWKEAAERIEKLSDVVELRAEEVRVPAWLKGHFSVGYEPFAEDR